MLIFFRIEEVLEKLATGTTSFEVDLLKHYQMPNNAFPCWCKEALTSTLYLKKNIQNYSFR